MTTQERKEQLERFHREFYADATTDQRRVEILTQMREWADEEMPESKCQSCQHTGVYAPYAYALIEGHCYSADGMRDYTNITKQCEYCFDKMCKEGDPSDDSIPEVGPR